MFEEPITATIYVYHVPSVNMNENYPFKITVDKYKDGHVLCSQNNNMMGGCHLRGDDLEYAEKCFHYELKESLQMRYDRLEKEFHQVARDLRIFNAKGIKGFLTGTFARDYNDYGTVIPIEEPTKIKSKS